LSDKKTLNVEVIYINYFIGLMLYKFADRAVLSLWKLIVNSHFQLHCHC